MAFEHKQFSDGEVSFKTPKWRQELETMYAENTQLNYRQALIADRKIKDDEISLKHPKNGSALRIRDDGTIEAFTAYGTGLRIRPQHALQVFSDQVQFVGREIDLRTTPNGTNLNGEVLGRDGFQQYPYKKGLGRSFLDLAKTHGVNTYGLEEQK